MVLMERSYHREYSFEISKLFTHCSNVISKVKPSERRTELQNDSQHKNNITPISDLGGKKTTNRSREIFECRIKNSG